MPILRKTIRHSARERTRRIDRAFERIAQALIVANLLFIGATWFSERETIRITDVVINGTLATDPALLDQTATELLHRPMLWRIARDNIILYPKRAIGAALKRSDARVKEVDVALLDRRRLVATVSEYAPSLLWCPPERVSATTTAVKGCYFADETGHIFSRAPEYSGIPFFVYATTYPEIDERTFLSGRSILPKDEFAIVNAFLDRLLDLELRPRIIHEVGPHDYLIVTQMPWTIRWTSAGDPAVAVEHLALVLEHLSNDEGEKSEIEMIDLRFGNKVFYR